MVFLWDLFIILTPPPQKKNKKGIVLLTILILIIKICMIIIIIKIKNIFTGKIPFKAYFPDLQVNYKHYCIVKLVVRYM